MMHDLESGMRRAVAGYSRDRRDKPLGSYLATLGIYNGLLAAFLWKGRIAREPERLAHADLLLLGIATHKLSRVLTKELVTAPLRAPFTRFQEYLGYGEVNEEARGTGPRQVLGELLSCNYCADFWVAFALLVGLDRAPKRARLLLKFFASVALADFLHVGYESTRTQANVLTLREEKLEQQKAA